jgi:hypothetical protein
MRRFTYGDTEINMYITRPLEEKTVGKGKKDRKRKEEGAGLKKEEGGTVCLSYKQKVKREPKKYKDKKKMKKKKKEGRRKKKEDYLERGSFLQQAINRRVRREVVWTF